MNRYKWTINGYYDYPLEQALEIELDSTKTTPQCKQLCIISPFNYE